MATIDRVDPAYVPWSPSTAGYTATEDEEYIGKHRRAAARRLSFIRMFYSPRHRRR